MIILEQLISCLEPLNIAGQCNRPVSGISFDSRKVKPGEVFVAIQGLKKMILIGEVADKISGALQNGVLATKGCHPESGNGSPIECRRGRSDSSLSRLQLLLGGGSLGNWLGTFKVLKFYGVQVFKCSSV